MAILFGSSPCQRLLTSERFCLSPQGCASGVVCVENAFEAIASEIISCMNGIPPDYLQRPSFPAPYIAFSRIYDAHLPFHNLMGTNTKSIDSLAG
jgi:hypothetical protein